MDRIESERGVTISFEKQGSGPPLVLVHGGFSDHSSNWEFVLPLFARQFTVYAIARRGRGETDATEGHGLEDEIQDVVELIRAIGEPVSLAGHSYGAHVALGAAGVVPGRVRKLVLYEAPWPANLGGDVPEPLTTSARAGDWDSFSFWFFQNVLLVPVAELNSLRATELWAPILADAKASLGDLRALSKYDFRCERFTELRMPVLLQIGTESPRHLYITDKLSEVLADARIERLEGQAHEGMTTAPELYAQSVIGFLAGAARGSHG
jgi:pimeloyl-ACP methyl ester carboxylesterase